MELKQKLSFTGYEKLVIFILAITQFTVILDFMVMSPLGDLLVKSIDMEASKFGIVVSAYAFSAGISGLLTAGFADKYDRKKLLLFFYIGFIIGTALCGIANDFYSLVAARIVTGLFGGVIGSISLAIITDLFVLEKRGRVMGFVQMGFGASQVLGIPIGIYLANLWGWEAPFFLIAILALLIAILIAWKLKPVREHLALQQEKNVFTHLWNTIKNKNYRIGFMTTAMLSIGGFMMMPYGTIFAVNNLKVATEQLPTLFMVSGISALVIMPIVGKISDSVSKLRLFSIAAIWLSVVCIIYTNLSATPFYLVLLTNVCMMIGILSRSVPASALTSAVPDAADRGAFMSVNASLQQIAGGIAAVIAGLIVHQQDKNSPLEHYNIVGYVLVVVTLLSIYFMARVDHIVRLKKS
ncbi:MFS transporter [Sphingobacterium sp. Mn56C]|uniref:MFS transporter n=1 Tax=Sphingobacterium sp. Mn56C TaxID=3395261 RepID=UPI003BCD8583